MMLVAKPQLTELRYDPKLHAPKSPSPVPERDIVIIGGGFAGIVTAIKLLDTARSLLRITIVEPRAELGGGLAYSTRESAHLMNGPAKLFSLHPERPEHFVNYLTRFSGDWSWSDPLAAQMANAFAPRSVYGDYLRSELARAAARAAPWVTFTHISTEATEVRRRGARTEVVLANDNVLAADHVILALGANPSQPELPIDAAARTSSRYIANPWDLESFEQLPRNGRVLLIGTGLTALDALVTLEKRGFRGRYLAISRRGRLVFPRREVTPLRDFLAESPLPKTALGLLRAARAELASVTRARPDWQSLVLAIRPHVSALWERASEVERARFLRHLRPIWEISLHRAPPRAAALLERGQAEGWFEHRAARLTALEAGPRKTLVARLRPRGKDAVESLTVDAVINCTGASYDWTRGGTRLTANLLDAGIVRPGPLSFGIDADAQAAIISRDGTVAADISAIGPALRGVRWESNTVVEILHQAIQLANRITTLPHRAETTTVELSASA
jgi:uncharacterized NAD(P)/FAD-binding protein YdhS